MSNASLYKWRAKYGGVDAPLISEMKAIEGENRRLKRMYADLSTQADQDFATQWLWTYNNDRPNMGIGGISPAHKLKMAA